MLTLKIPNTALIGLKLTQQLLLGNRHDINKTQFEYTLRTQVTMC